MQKSADRADKKDGAAQQVLKALLATPEVQASVGQEVVQSGCPSPAQAPTTNSDVKALILGVDASLCHAPSLWSVWICVIIIHIVTTKSLLTIVDKEANRTCKLLQHSVLYVGGTAASEAIAVSPWLKQRWARSWVLFTPLVSTSCPNVICTDFETSGRTGRPGCNLSQDFCSRSLPATKAG